MYKLIGARAASASLPLSRAASSRLIGLAGMSARTRVCPRTRLPRLQCRRRWVGCVNAAEKREGLPSRSCLLLQQILVSWEDGHRACGLSLFTQSREFGLSM